MSQEVLEIIQTLETDHLHAQLVLQCAPTMSGLKPSNMLTIPVEDWEELMELLQYTTLSYDVLLVTEQKITLLIYKKEALISCLQSEQVQKFLFRMGYSVLTLERILPVFRLRYQEFRKNPDRFPHEMGILLGYPVEDVEGFIENDGKNALYTGYWKVYQDKLEKQQLFHRYEQAKAAMLRLLCSGTDIRDIIVRSEQNNMLQRAAV